MKYKQNFMIMQVTETTLIVGVDIAKNVHYARIFDWRGIEYDKVYKFKANGTGFKDFIDWVKQVAKKNNKDKIMIGIEPTGHYWYTFAQAVIEEGIQLVQVNPFHVKRCKELDDNTQTKSDNKDPKTIAKLVIDGRYQIPYIPKEIYSDLRKLYVLRSEWIEKIITVKNRVQRWLDIHFPEFLKVFSSWEGKTALVTLDKMSIPSQITEMTAEQILKVWKETVQRGVGIKRAEKLLSFASKSVGMKDGLVTAEYEIKLLIKEYTEIDRVLIEIEEKLEKLVRQVPSAENILKIKGIGIKTAAGFFAEVGDISRFTHPKQIIKLAGLNLVESSSGNHKGQTTISKRGRSRLRSLLFRAILPMLATNEEFKALHQYNISDKEKPLKKMQSLIALCGKLIRVIYKIVTQNVEYDASKMLGDIRRVGTAKAA